MEPNVAISGDEARALMVALASSPSNLPSNLVINLYIKLAVISQVQPPKQIEE